MPIDHKEQAFEAAIEHHLLNQAGYAKAEPSEFNWEWSLDPIFLNPFLRETKKRPGISDGHERFRAHQFAACGCGVRPRQFHPACRGRLPPPDVHNGGSVIAKALKMPGTVVLRKSERC